ncbi:hypothetical protein ABIF90_008145 [Bradyrhizobium japonicum]
MGGDPKRGDRGSTRDPKRNAQIGRQAAGTPDFGEYLEAASDMEKSIDGKIESLLNAWQTQVDSAITDAPNPLDDESRKYFWIALAGNLLWASTVFLNPAVAGELTLIRVMSGVGAAIGSGAYERTSKEHSSDNAPPPHDPKYLMREQVAKARGTLEEHFKTKRHEFAWGFPELKDWPKSSALDALDRYMWKQMFPWIRYDTDRFNNIRLEALEKVKGTLADYNRQWQQYKQATVWAGKAELKRRNVEFRPILLISFGGKVLSGRAADRLDTKFH